jgi:hypothetical protein
LKSRARLAVVFTAAALSSASCSDAASSLDDVDPALFALAPTYANHIEPMFAEYCTACHSSDGARLGGVELDRYETAYARRIQNTCVSLTQPVIDHFARELVPLRIRLSTGTASIAAAACKDEGEGGELRPWPPYSMPKGARSGLTLEEQVILGRWVETGATP